MLKGTWILGRYMYARATQASLGAATRQDGVRSMNPTPEAYHQLRTRLNTPRPRRFDALELARSSRAAPPRTFAQQAQEALAAETAQWPVPTCIADAEALLAQMAPPQRSLCLATALRLLVEATEAVEVSDPGGLMLPAVCEAFEQRAQSPGEPETRFVPMESVDQVPSALLRRTLLYCMQLLLAEATPAIVAKLIGQLSRMARQGGLEHFFPLWWVRCQRRLAFQSAATAPLA